MSHKLVSLYIGDGEYYTKIDADNVIAELEERIADGDKDFEIANNQNERLLKIVSRHKYKRCLANAEACMHKRWRTDEGFDYARSTRHMKKWLELAEKFKEAK